jgi:hypothetical protein
VKCSICGELSHPTRDCPLKKVGDLVLCSLVLCALVVPLLHQHFLNCFFSMTTLTPQDEPTSAVVLDSEYDSFMAELDGGGGGGPRVSTNNTKTETSKKSESEGGTVTMLGTVDLSGILGTPASSSSYKSAYQGSAGGVGVGAMPSAAPKRQQTIIVVTTVLTGFTGTTTSYPVPTMTAPPIVSYATASSSLPVMPLAGGISAPWAVPSQPQLHPHTGYSYSGYENNPNAYYPPVANGYYQQPQNPWGAAPPLTSIPPPPPAEVVPLPPPPSASSSSSPWMTTVEQEQQGQQGIPYNYMTGR